jgi:hypothetical protein
MTLSRLASVFFSSPILCTISCSPCMDTHQIALFICMILPKFITSLLASRAFVVRQLRCGYARFLNGIQVLDSRALQKPKKKDCGERGNKIERMCFVYIYVLQSLPRLDGSIPGARARGFLIIRPICQL